LSIWEEGNTPVLIDWRIPCSSCINLLKQCNAEECYIDEEVIKKWDSVEVLYSGINFKPVIVDKNNCVTYLDKGLYKKYKANYSDEEGIIFFSSGTTGSSKGIILSHKSISLNADAIIDYMKPHECDSFYIVKTLVHSSTLVGELLVALKCNANVLVSSTVATPRMLLKRIEDYKPTIMCLNPTLLTLLLRSYKSYPHDVSSVRLLYTSGAIVSTKVLNEAEEVFTNAKVRNVYGLTEAGPRVTAQRSSEYGEKKGSVGKPIRGVEVRVIDISGVDCQPLQNGIIHVKTPSKMIGYTNTKGERAPLIEGWINTGDIGYLDEEGDLYIVAREDDMIIRSGHNVYPDHIENIIKNSLLVEDCIVFGVPDDIGGHRIICYYCTKRDNTVEDENEVQAKIREFCSRYLAAYEIPQEFYSVEVMPSTAYGKISKKQAQIDYYNTYNKAKN
jgi:long-chain acyl-CoA synthetase